MGRTAHCERAIRRNWSQSPLHSWFPCRRGWLGSRPSNKQGPKITCNRGNRGTKGLAAGSLTFDGAARVRRLLLFLFPDIHAPDWLQLETEPKCCGRAGVCHDREQAQWQRG